MRHFFRYLGFILFPLILMLQQKLGVGGRGGGRVRLKTYYRFRINLPPWVFKLQKRQLFINGLYTSHALLNDCCVMRSLLRIWFEVILKNKYVEAWGIGAQGLVLLRQWSPYRRAVAKLCSTSYIILSIWLYVKFKGLVHMKSWTIKIVIFAVMLACVHGCVYVVMLSSL